MRRLISTSLLLALISLPMNLPTFAADTEPKTDNQAEIVDPNILVTSEQGLNLGQTKDALLSDALLEDVVAELQELGVEIKASPKTLIDRLRDTEKEAKIKYDLSVRNAKTGEIIVITTNQPVEAFAVAVPGSGYAVPGFPGDVIEVSTALSFSGSSFGALRHILAGYITGYTYRLGNSKTKRVCVKKAEYDIITGGFGMRTYKIADAKYEDRPIGYEGAELCGSYELHLNISVSSEE